MEKRILVTGGTRGLGLEISRYLVAQGYTVVATGRTVSEPLQALIDDPATAGRLAFMPLELAETDKLHEFINELKRRHGPLWGIVNNAAVARDGVLATLHESDVHQTILVNVTATILLTKYALRTMLAQRAGRVINISSIVSHSGFNGLSVYAASKSAMLGFTRSLAREVGKVGITVNAVCPGYMETDMSAGLDDAQLDSIRRRSAIRRLTEPADVASAVGFLLSEEANGITGTTLTVDAGSTA